MLALLHIIAAFLSVALARPSYGEDGGDVAFGDHELEAGSPLVQLGTCQLAQDPELDENIESLFFKMCVRGQGGAELNTAAGYPEENYWLRYGSLYGGLFVTPYLSAHAKAHIHHREPLGDVGQPFFARSTDYAFLRLGNPVLHPYRVNLGHVLLPFGIDRTETPQSYQLADNQAFWSAGRHGVTLSMDDQLQSQLELGCATNEFSEIYREAEIPEGGDSTREPDSAPRRRGCAIRFMRDLSALEGSRLTASGYADEEGERRIGAGILTINRRGDATHFEFVRLLTSLDGKQLPFQQLLRLGFVGAWRGGQRWVVQIDDERQQFRRGVLSYEGELFDHFSARVALGYHKSESGDGVKRWLFTTGLEVSL